ncbi:hypothetical protein CCY99_02195 [Helicobacter sp. 16-1353]|uniref:DUF4149 domain-containing protein n=1 Tax=Helicobacter sp. 16-1353 TaxID=2004996 RepID=UPI000DCDAF76|nr:DUF4149 domain-containing protein [Helicobacter sp. 16-1353]RAX54971.1 hypothetical protein CCY99_02195 [Helicobacter sp. 16-1353]
MVFFFSKVFINSINAFYNWILGLSIGAIIASGAFVAPVIFRASNFGVELDLAQSGILMTAIFLKLNALLLFVAFIIAVYEIFSLRLSSHTRIQKAILFVSGGISVVCILLFALYYTPFILESQELGTIATSEFNAMHKQSEFVFNVLFFALSINLIYRNLVRM